MNNRAGSIEEQERQRLLNLAETQSVNSMASTRAGSVFHQVHNPVMQEEVEVLEFNHYSDHNNDLRRQQEENERKIQLQRQIRQIRVPTSEAEVKSQLRQMGHPVTYFGEQGIDRRERLRKLLADHLTQYGRLPTFETRMNKAQRDQENQYFLYPGKENLRDLRLMIAKSSLKEAAVRVEKSRLRRLLVDALEEDKEVDQACQEASKYEVIMSQFADSNCVSRGCISPNQQLFGTAGGSGECKIWNVSDTILQSSLLGHLTKAHSIAFHPQSTIGLSPNSYANVATASSDLGVRLWTLNLDDERTEDHGILQKSILLKGHEERVNKVLYHRLGNILFSLSYDKTWRIWDLETQDEVLVQTGHSKAIYSGALHPDGSLLFTGDLGGFGMIWDLRTGKGVLPIVGHIKGILSANFSPNGYHLATGSDDNHIRIWDIRRRAPLEKLPAHTRLVSDVEFKPDDGRWLISSSYDATVKVWNTRDWSLCKTFDGHKSMITSVSLTNEYMITTGIEKEFVVWKKQGF